MSATAPACPDGRRPVAIVTGGASGIGAAITDRFLAEGMTVVAFDVDGEQLTALQQRRGGARLQVAVVDVGDAEAVKSAIDAVAAEHGGLDTVVANAGIAAPGTAVDVTLEGWHAVLRVDLDGVFHAIRFAVPHLTRTKGSVVATASISGLAGDHRLAAYDAAKAAVVNLVRSAAVDFGAEGVRVNAVAPSPVLTDGLRNHIEAMPRIREQYEENIPLRRLAEPSEIADVVAWLASAGASYVTGVTIPVDGGLTAWSGQPRIMG